MYKLIINSLTLATPLEIPFIVSPNEKLAKPVLAV